MSLKSFLPLDMDFREVFGNSFIFTMSVFCEQTTLIPELLDLFEDCAIDFDLKLLAFTFSNLHNLCLGLVYPHSILLHNFIQLCYDVLQAFCFWCHRQGQCSLGYFNVCVPDKSVTHSYPVFVHNNSL